jgi:hypothetical protein
MKKAIVSMHKALAAHHERCEKILRTHSEGCDEEDPHRGTFAALAQEHKSMGMQHRIIAQEVAATPDGVEHFDGHDAQPGKAIGVDFAKLFSGADEDAATTALLFPQSDFDQDCQRLPWELRRMVKAE